MKYCLVSVRLSIPRSETTACQEAVAVVGVVVERVRTHNE